MRVLRVSWVLPLLDHFPRKARRARRARRKAESPPAAMARACISARLCLPGDAVDERNACSIDSRLRAGFL